MGYKISKNRRQVEEVDIELSLEDLTDILCDLKHVEADHKIRKVRLWAPGMGPKHPGAEVVLGSKLTITYVKKEEPDEDDIPKPRLMRGGKQNAPVHNWCPDCRGDGCEELSYDDSKRPVLQPLEMKPLTKEGKEELRKQAQVGGMDPHIVHTGRWPETKLFGTAKCTEEAKTYFMVSPGGPPLLCEKKDDKLIYVASSYTDAVVFFTGEIAKGQPQEIAPRGVLVPCPECAAWNIASVPGPWPTCKKCLLPPWPKEAVGCDNDCAPVRAGVGIQCKRNQNGEACGRYWHPGDDGYKELDKFMKAREATGDKFVEW